MEKVTIFWFRRDLRLNDNTGLCKALESDCKVVPIFIFDTDILDQLENKFDRRVDYLHQALQEIHNELKVHKSGLSTFYGKPMEIFQKLIKEYDIEAVFCNRDYEPQALQRDKGIKSFLNKNNITFNEYKDQVIFEKNEVVKNDGKPYTVFTPYSKKWLENFGKEKTSMCTTNFNQFLDYSATQFLTLKDIGFEKTDIKFEQPLLPKELIDDYDQYRDFPALDHTTRLGIDLRFGTLSIRKCVEVAAAHNQIWLKELIWREFFMQILYHFPKVVHHNFYEKYDNIEWRNNEEEFKLWCEGKTGYLLVDAGMRQMNKTGFMHNRVRMVVASFLTKHLLIDWRWGEAYFAEKLLDYELSSNNGNWQWAAGTGCDASPYFRVFNPYEQIKKFDKDFKFIKKWLSEDEINNAYPIVEHSFARERALKVYKKAVQ